jgi:hypothetical protein
MAKSVDEDLLVKSVGDGVGVFLEAWTSRGPFALSWLLALGANSAIPAIWFGLRREDSV